MTADIPHESVYVHTNGIRLHVVQSGPPEGPVLLLLHGFPEFWYGWRRQIGYFAGRGFRVWAPDLRGYNLSDKPAGAQAYRMSEIVADIVGLIGQTGQRQVFAAGHDFGAMAAWMLAASHPQLVKKAVMINVPHPRVLTANLLKSPQQMIRSSYMAFFQLPFLPELILRRNNWRLAAAAMAKSSRPGTFTEAELHQYRAAWSRPKAFTSMLNWYRALPRQIGGLKAGPCEVPSLVIWGEKDAFLRREMAEQSMKWCTDGRLELIPQATHWVHLEEAERVNRTMERFFS
ncbi:alpha/beta hydrolase [Paenibacillus sambharensis]|uniref:Alpha/beta hydrolase n=1 Tax=Paenibacillus sambharensis TaxID=1803190 RepID=A0A2W1LP87_9BACL|nr:alpha/beta hydrolase [Paenibacillus sambharensis]PZD96334.1 alpha/beta hydrolase [Paenibacillus sambharensis]